MNTRHVLGFVLQVLENWDHESRDQAIREIQVELRKPQNMPLSENDIDKLIVQCPSKTDLVRAVERCHKIIGNGDTNENGLGKNK